MFSLDTNYRNKLTFFPLSSQAFRFPMIFHIQYATLPLPLYKKRNIPIQRLNQNFEKGKISSGFHERNSWKLDTGQHRGEADPQEQGESHTRRLGVCVRLSEPHGSSTPASQALRNYWNICIIFNKKQKF